MATQLVKRYLAVFVHIHTVQCLVDTTAGLTWKTVLVQLCGRDHCVHLVTAEDSVPVRVGDAETLPEQAPERLAQHTKAGSREFRVLEKSIAIGIQAGHVGLGISRLASKTHQRCHKLRFLYASIPIEIARREYLSDSTQLADMELRGHLQKHDLLKL
jgi:hypothetical protein